jgi:hypothetical protein
MNTFDANRSYPKNRSGWSGIREAAIALPFANDVARAIRNGRYRAKLLGG